MKPKLKTASKATKQILYGIMLGYGLVYACMKLSVMV